MFVSVLMTPIVFPSYLSSISSSLHLPLNRLPGHPFVSPTSSLNALLASLSSLFSLSSLDMTPLSSLRESAIFPFTTFSVFLIRKGGRGSKLVCCCFCFWLFRSYGLSVSSHPTLSPFGCFREWAMPLYLQCLFFTCRLFTFLEVVDYAELFRSVLEGSRTNNFRKLFLK